MQLDLEIHGRSRRVAVAREADRFLVSVDGRRWVVDAVRVDPQTLSLLIEDGGHKRSYEVAISPRRADRGLTVHVGTAAVTVGVETRRGVGKRDDDGDPAQAGPQQVRTSMPGRVVRVLVKRGDAVRAGQGLVVIEAMKMENELRAGRDGRVADVRVRDAMPVEAGALLVVIE